MKLRERHNVFSDDLAKNLIKGEMKSKGLKVKDLLKRLEPYGETMSVTSFNNKMHRGGFSVDFFLKCMDAMGVKTLKLCD